LLVVLHQWYHRGGTELHAKSLTKGLANEYDITVVFPDERVLVVVRDGLEIGRLPADPFEWPTTPVHARTTTSSLAALLAWVRPDLVHIQHIFRWPLGTIEQLLQWCPRVLLSLHDYYYLTPDFTMRHAADDEDLVGSLYSCRAFGGDISPYLERRRNYLRGVLAAVPRLICPSAGVQRVMQRQIEGRYQVVEHGIEPFVVQQRVPAHDLIRFGFMGSLIPQKGFDVLLKAFDRVRQKYSHVRLLLCGWGPDIDPSAFPAARFCGPYESADLPFLLSQMDIGVIPSVFRETYSLVLSEFWHAGLPVLASRIGALAERIAGVMPELLVEPGSEEALAFAMEQVVENPLWRTMAPPRPRYQSEMLADYRRIYSEMT
jgi:glycosyltransferase involved in cell wall biosynthesis